MHVVFVNFVDQVSCREIIRYNEGAGKKVVLVDCYVYLQNGSVSTDSLTGINNRRRFDRFTRYAWDNMKTPQDNMFLMILDINRFKQINDEFGMQGFHDFSGLGSH